MPKCFFAHLGGCQGRLVKAHLIPKQRLRREANALIDDGRLSAVDYMMGEFVWDKRVWVPMCGGPTGIGGHHGAFDAKQIGIARDDLPEGVEEFAREYGLAWSLEADYGLPGNFLGAEDAV